MGPISGRRTIPCLIDTVMLKNIALLLLLIYVGLAVAVMIFQRSLIYFPTSPVSVSGLADVALENNGVRLRGHMANPEGRCLLLYFGGNAEQIAYSLQFFANELDDIAVAGFHYRGYAGSAGEPSERALYQDALFLFDYFKHRYACITVIGRSLGSGVASYLAGQRVLHRLVLITPFDSIEALAAKVYWFFPVRWMLTDKFDSYARASRISVPTLLLLAENDRIIPTSNSMRLYHALPQEKAQYRMLSDVGHNSIDEHSQYWPTIREFIR